MLRERQAGVAGPIHGCEHRIAHRIALHTRAGVQQIHKAMLVVWEQEPEKQRAREKVLLLRVLVFNFTDSYYSTKVIFIRTLLLAKLFFCEPFNSDQSS